MHERHASEHDSKRGVLVEEALFRNHPAEGFGFRFDGLGFRGHLSRGSGPLQQPACHKVEGRCVEGGGQRVPAGNDEALLIILESLGLLPEGVARQLVEQDDAGQEAVWLRPLARGEAFV